MAEQELRRFGAALADALRDRGLDPTRPITVAEIYQDLVPYRTHRDVLGVEMNGDYEHLLLRALAGEGGVLTLQSAAALEQLREELESNNPNTGLYREFAAVDVLLSEPGEAGVVGSIGAAAPADEAVSITELSPEVEAEPEPRSSLAFEAPAPTPVEAAPEPIAAPEPAAVTRIVTGGQARGGDTCQWCRQVLPDRPNLKFCPFCGTDLKIVPCHSCGEALEPGWRFCIACGDEVISEG